MVFSVVLSSCDMLFVTLLMVVCPLKPCCGPYTGSGSPQEDLNAKSRFSNNEKGFCFPSTSGVNFIHLSSESDLLSSKYLIRPAQIFCMVRLVPLIASVNSLSF